MKGFRTPPHRPPPWCFLQYTRCRLPAVFPRHGSLSRLPTIGLRVSEWEAGASNVTINADLNVGQGFFRAERCASDLSKKQCSAHQYRAGHNWLQLLAPPLNDHYRGKTRTILRCVPLVFICCQPDRHCHLIINENIPQIEDIEAAFRGHRQCAATWSFSFIKAQKSARTRRLSRFIFEAAHSCHRAEGRQLTPILISGNAAPRLGKTNSD